MGNFFGKIDKPVFWVSAILSLAIVAWGAISPSSAGNAFAAIVKLLTTNLGWLYILVVTFFLLFSIFIAFSKYGNIKLGKDDDVPEFSTVSWFAMLFSSGMGISLIFWCIAEPLKHYLAPQTGMAGGTAEAAADAMQTVFYHWGLHPWGIFAVIGMAMAYCQFRKGMPALCSSTLVPLIGEKGARGPIGKAVDIMAGFATVFGVAVSLGMGALQMNAGLNEVFGIPKSVGSALIIIAVITTFYTFTAITGIEKGIKFFSNLNLVLVFGLLAFVFLAGPTRFILDVLTDTLGLYSQNILKMSFFTDPYGKAPGWLSKWTIFYWCWWIAWAPPVGGFVARISKGRTIREFVLGVLIAPTVLSFVWMATFGGTAINLQMSGTDIGAIVDKDVTRALFVFLGQFPLASLMSSAAVILISTFFITSANSATFVMGMFTSGGDLNPGNGLKGFWGIIMGAIASVMLLAGGLDALQNAPIVSTLPFMIVMVFMSFACVKFFKAELKESSESSYLEFDAPKKEAN